MDGGRTAAVTSRTLDRTHERENPFPILDALAFFDATADIHRVGFDLGNRLRHVGRRHPPTRMTGLLSSLGINAQSNVSPVPPGTPST